MRDRVEVLILTEPVFNLHHAVMRQLDVAMASQTCQTGDCLPRALGQRASQVRLSADLWNVRGSFSSVLKTIVEIPWVVFLSLKTRSVEHI